jgi:hypothetical protein
VSEDPKVFNNPDIEVFPCPHTEGLQRYKQRTGVLTPYKNPTEVHPKVVELITELRVKRPGWEFVASNGLTRDLHIYTKDKEYLGVVEYVIAYYGAERDYFHLKNFRIREESIKATAGRCYSVKKAVERTLAKFRPRNMEELVKARKEAARKAVAGIVTGQRSKWILSSASAKRTDIVFTVLDNPEAFANTPVAPLLTPTIIQEWQDYSAARVLNDPTNFEIVTETERDGTKQLYNITGMPEAYWLDAEQHGEVISKVAMLRMVDVGHVVTGIGFRSDEHTFVVLGKEPKPKLT